MIRLRKANWSGLQFAPSSPQVARCVLRNITSEALGCQGVLYLNNYIASSGPIGFTIQPLSDKSVDFPLVMPQQESIYGAFLDVFVNQELVLHYPFPQTIEIISAQPGAWDISVTSFLQLQTLTGSLGAANAYHTHVIWVMNTYGISLNNIIMYVNLHQMETGSYYAAREALSAGRLVEFLNCLGGRDTQVGVEACII